MDLYVHILGKSPIVCHDELVFGKKFLDKRPIFSVQPSESFIVNQQLACYKKIQAVP